MRVLLSCDPLQGGDSLEKESDLMVWREAATACIQLLGAIRCLQPGQNVLDYALMELMEDIWRDGSEDVDVGKAFPEGMGDGLDSGLPASLVECSRCVLNLGKSIEDLDKITKRAVGVGVIAHLISWDVAFRAGSILATGDEELFRVVADIHGEDGMPAPHNAITTGYCNTVGPSQDERFEDCGEAGMKEVC